MPEARPYRRVLALIGFDASDGLVARKALALARLNHAELDFLHLIDPDALFDGGYSRSGGPTAAARALEQAALRRLNFVAAACGALDARCHALYGPRRQGFLRHLEAGGGDLVVTAEPSACFTGAHDLLVLGSEKPRRVQRILNLLWRRLAPARALARI